MFQVWTVLTKISKIQPSDLLILAALYYLLHQQVSFFTNFRTSFNIMKKDYCQKFSFFNRFTQTPHPLNGQNPLSMTIFFCHCSVIVLVLAELVIFCGCLKP